MWVEQETIATPTTNPISHFNNRQQRADVDYSKESQYLDQNREWLKQFLITIRNNFQSFNPPAKNHVAYSREMQNFEKNLVAAFDNLGRVKALLYDPAERPD